MKNWKFEFNWLNGIVKTILAQLFVICIIPYIKISQGLGVDANGTNVDIFNHFHTVTGIYLPSLLLCGSIILFVLFSIEIRKK